MAMSKTVAAGFQSRFAHFITVGSGTREAGEFRAEDQGREGTVGGAKGTEVGGREWRGLTQRGPWERLLSAVVRFVLEGLQRRAYWPKPISMGGL